MSSISNVKIIFWGTPEFAILALKALVENGYDIAAVITNPDEPVGRKQIMTPPPVKIFAEKYKIPVFQPINLKDGNFIKELPSADLYIVASYGKIIPKGIIEIPKLGTLNIHPSLLPRWRGPSPIQYTILNSDEETGVTIMKIDELMDHGPIVAKSKIKNQKIKTTYRELHDKLAELGTKLLIETLPKYIAGKIEPVPQDDSKATYSKILKRNDGRIDWSRSAEEIERQIRAYESWPGSFTVWPDGENYLRLKIEEAEATDEEPVRGSSGFIWQNSKSGILAKTGKGSIELKKITPAGSKTMKTEEFLRGHPKFIGTNLI